jgi:hypothetical protein
VRQTDWENRAPLLVVNAWIDETSVNGTDIVLLLNREPEDGTELHVAYGRGLDPACSLTDEADMPLCGFSWLPVSTEDGNR